MSRLSTIDPAKATGKSKELLEIVQATLKIIPNMTKVMANSPAVLQGYLAFSGALAEASLSPKLREQIALAVGQSNQCEYCVSAHSVIGKGAGLTDEEVRGSRRGEGESERTRAALRFARQLLENKGFVQESAIGSLRAAGFSDGEIAEIIAHVALNVFTNYFNTAAGVEIDFPRVAVGRSA
jgi:uncharacterized peroxidase-related enzyme